MPGAANGTPAYLKTWATGNAASKLDAMDQDLALRNIHKKLINVRPSLRGNIQPISSWSWQKEEGAGSTYVAWQPNQIKKYSNTISSPIPPLFLAGEYSAKQIEEWKVQWSQVRGRQMKLFIILVCPD